MILKNIAIIEYCYCYEYKEENFKGRFYIEYEKMKNKSELELLLFIKEIAEIKDLSINIKDIIDVYILEKSLIII